MKKPEVIKATYRIVTPMFIGDAAQEATGVSAASVKGALRFWWRALNWGRVRKKSKNDVEALNTLHEKEAELFGSSAYDNKQRRKENKQHKQGIGQSRFILKVKITEDEPGVPEVQESGLKYLLGQGLYSHREGVQREAILAGEIQVECILHPCVDDLQKKELACALLALGVMGGLGSRARRGFGSLAIIKLESSGDGNVPSVPQTKEQLKALLAGWKLPVDMPPFTAFSKETRIDFSLSGSDALYLLNRAGEELQCYRSWGNRGRLNGKPAEQRFKESHDLMYNIAQGANPDCIPAKAIFGLPQDYKFSSGKQVKFSLCETGRNRRASPLFIHIYQFPDKKCLLMQLVLPAIFLNDSAKLKFKVPGSAPKWLKYKNSMTKNWCVIEENVNSSEKKQVWIVKNQNSGTQNPVSKSKWDVIRDYLDRPGFKNRETI